MDDPEKAVALAELRRNLQDMPLYFVRAFARMVDAMVDMNNGVKDIDAVALRVKRRYHLQELLRVGFPGEENLFENLFKQS